MKGKLTIRKANVKLVVKFVFNRPLLSILDEIGGPSTIVWDRVRL